MNARTLSAFIVTAVTLVAASSCGSSPVAPDVPPRLSAPPPLNLTGTWSGRGSDPQGDHRITLTLSQSGAAVSGTAITRAVEPNGTTCASCHKVKDGTLTGMLSGSALALKMTFPAGGDVPTPICSVTMDATAASVTNGKIEATYTGEDSCEGPFTGSVTMERQP